MGVHDNDKHVIEYAPTSKSRCRGPKSCPNRTIAQGSLRLGGPKRFVPMYDREVRKCRHWECERVRKAVLTGLNDPDEGQAPANANDDDEAQSEDDPAPPPPPTSTQSKKKRKKAGSDGDDDDGDWKQKPKICFPLKIKAKKTRK
ncbi:hypothetical protein M427DRAFT_134119 [Gonapodya prolifera JEL478]|uniref:PARP-type domain-containing protein n=1 Tax=Gonapodya prolifera (strain JEL478) TaxID=1344416 RepID=A0A139AJC8_GONPJ|nr:hypothetical protein M427DRAFT_134119 [Gonapodya prolifera JEL478]|eukprot:KXS16515.1 hypothetical protein M427DRAFT_134119 [Gonapodya prolifera JEL478]